MIHVSNYCTCRHTGFRLAKQQIHILISELLSHAESGMYIQDTHSFCRGLTSNLLTNIQELRLYLAVYNMYVSN